MATPRFQEIETSSIPWDSCIRIGSMEAPMLWVLVSIMIFEPGCTGWFEPSDDQLEIRIREMTTALRRHGFDWKKESLMYMNTISPDA
eukprot:3892073-Pyramimonas_sp.AAC.2